MKEYGARRGNGYERPHASDEWGFRRMRYVQPEKTEYVARVRYYSIGPYVVDRGPKHRRSLWPVYHVAFDRAEWRQVA